ncbi:ion transporter [Streptomyces sp. NPDC046876]|uniref:ion transporter n=1 Tax=Streptomyces sp. NPDC046876 TaxID=3155616 RepID=UPI00340CEDEB
MRVAPDGRSGPGGPGAGDDSGRLERFEARMRLPMIAAAVLPLVVVPQPGAWFSTAVNVAAWLVFLADYVVHVRHLDRYTSSALGRFDLFVVIATAPWFLLPGAQAGRFVVVLRVARLARLLLVTRGARRLLARLQRVTVVATGVVLVAALIAYHAERPVNPEFATFGDALWWGVVTLTTVGYGDIAPQTSAGRWAGFGIMVTGIGVLGILAGILASFFGSEEDGGPAAAPDEQGRKPVTHPAEASLDSLTAEIAALRGQVEALTQRMAGPAPYPPRRDRPGDDQPR